MEGNNNNDDDNGNVNEEIYQLDPSDLIASGLLPNFLEDPAAPLDVIINNTIPDPDLLQHPIFQSINDPFLSIILQPLKSFISADPDFQLKYQEITNQFKASLHQNIFGAREIQDLHDQFEQLGLLAKQVCGKILVKGDIYFRCLDCDEHSNPALISILCSQCFENSNHDGHRVTVIKKESNSSAACDCGDANEMNSQGFCPNHQNKQIDLDTLLKLFPATIFQATQNTMKKAIYLIISLYELKQKTAHQSIEQLVKLLADLLLEELLKFCQTCYTQISGSFLFIFLKILQEQFLPTMNKVWHDCEDFTNEFSYNEISAEKSFSCKCSLLGNLLKIGNSISLEAQVMLQKILVESSTELKFKEFIMLEFTKYLHYLYNQDYTNDEDDETINSRLLNMQIQLYGREELLHKVIDAGYHKNFIEVIRRAVHGTLEVNYELYNILSDIRSALSYFTNLKYSTAKRLITQTDFMKDLFEILMNFQIKFSYPGAIHIGLYEHLVDYRSINRGLMIEKVICLILESGLRVLNKNLTAANEKSTFTKSIVSEWYVNFSLAKDILAEDQKNGSVSFHIGLERIFCAILRSSLLEEDFTKPALEGFLKQNLPDLDPQKLAEMILEGNFRTMGMIRYLTLVHNYNTGELWYVYYFFNNSFFEIDTVTAQLLTMLMKPEKLFQDMVQSFFSYSPELINFFIDPRSLKTQEDYLKQKISVLQDFLHYLIFLMNDEICLLNLDIKDRITAFEPFPNDNRYKRVVEKVCINLLLGHYWTDLSSVKADLEGVLRDQQQIDNIIMKITVLDEKTHKIRLKDEYQSELDPYIFYRKPSLQQEILNNIPNKSKNQDLISGQYYKNLSQYLKTIQKTLYQSSLPDFLTLFLDNYNEFTASLVRPVLKLVLMNLQVTQEFRNENNNILQIASKNYLTPKFTQTLKNLLTDHDLKDCRPCIMKIQAIINTLSAQSHQLSGTSMLIETAEDEKKRLAREKMEKLKAQFSQKQALFADVNKELLLEESPGLEETKTDLLTCQYCLEKIDQASEKYGIPIFITFTNNLFDTTDKAPFKEIDYNSLDQASWWPIISSCNHDYHQKCFENHFTNTRKPGDTASRYFNDQFETYCSLCKTLCNHFLCINNDGSQTTFPQKTVDIFSEMTKRLASILPPSQGPIEQEPYQVTPQDIFQRAYAHFLETFHIQNQPKILQKNLNIYKHFFNAFQPPSLNENYSLLADIIRTIKKSSQDPLQYDPQPLINHIMSQGIAPLQILKDYLAFRITQAVGFHAPNNLLTIKHCLPYYQGNKSLQETLSTDLIFPLQKIALAYFLNTPDHPLSTTKIADLICSPSQSNEDYLNSLLQTCGVSIAWSKFIEDIFTEDLPNQEKAHLDLLNSMLLPKTISPGRHRPTLTTRMAPRVLRLPDNYMEFNNTIYRQKCGICHEYSRDLLIVVCLICGDMVCQVSCEKTKVMIGNLNRHSAKYHMGMGLFLDVVELNKSLVNSPLNTINTMKETYIDNFGQPVQDILNSHNELGKLDFKQFGLNKEFVDEMEELIKNNSVAKELFRISIKATHYYEAGYL